jgi:hypothetical protein
MKMYELFEAKVEALEAKFDYAYLSCEDWLQVLTEKKLIDELLFGKISLDQVNDEIEYIMFTTEGWKRNQE